MTLNIDIIDIEVTQDLLEQRYFTGSMPSLAHNDYFKTYVGLEAGIVITEMIEHYWFVSLFLAAYCDLVNIHN